MCVSFVLHASICLRRLGGFDVRKPTRITINVNNRRRVHARWQKASAQKAEAKATAPTQGPPTKSIGAKSFARPPPTSLAAFALVGPPAEASATLQ